VPHAKRITCGRDAFSAWLLLVAFLARVELAGGFFWGAIRIAGASRCVPPE